MRNRYLFSALITASIAATLSLAGAQGPSATLEEQLQSQYTLTSLTADNAAIATPGTILTLRRGGFSAGAASNKVPTRNTYKNGQIRSEIPGALKNCTICSSIPWANKAGSAMSSAGSFREFMTGENLYVTKINVDRSKDTIVFTLVSDPYPNAGTYKGSLLFQYSKGLLASADLSQVQPTIAEVFKTTAPQYPVTAAPPPTAQPLPSELSNPPQQPSVPQPAQAQPEAPLLPLEIPVAPTLDEPAAPGGSKVIAPGQTTDQVIAALGKPLSVTSGSGNREIYEYKYVRITFVNGKVSDVE
jgi:hypothetical protein